MRIIHNLNIGWEFVGQSGVPEAVNIPHTWNSVDGQDGGNNYYRGTCSYTRTFTCPEFDKDNQRVYLEFMGVNSSAEVKVNGTKIMYHEGGYSTFRKDITQFLQKENTLHVNVDNSVNDKIYPQMADFTFYGGIYRDVQLIVVSKDHFDMDYYGGTGVKITPTVEGKVGKVEIETFHNASSLDVEITILDQEGKTVISGTGMKQTFNIENPHLWDGVKDPYLYTAVTTLLRNGEKVDEVRNSFGIRSFHVDPDKGFFLNGRSYPLHGVSRHQDYRGIGNALEKEHHDRDMELIRELGVNTIRLAHYQHSQYFYDLCDKYGMIVWAEIPYISSHLNNGRENTISQMKELIIQNYNHPSIVTWGISNEITMKQLDKKDMLDNHKVLNDLCHEMDKTRPTTLACYAMCVPFHPVVHCTDIVGYNLYLGWYVPGLILNDLFMKYFHWRYPNRSLGYSEYGAEGMPNLHSSRPRRGDNTEEYQAKYHEYMLECFARHPFLWATHVWNMFDFAADARDQGGEPGMNHKGLVTFDRKTKKDSFYLYKAYWSEDPFVHICSKRYVNRTDKKATIKVYSNLDEVTLYHNGKQVETKKGNKVFTFKVKLEQENRFEVKSKQFSDTSIIKRVPKKDKSYIMKKAGSTKNWQH